MSKINSVPKTRFTNAELLNFCNLIIGYLSSINLSTLKYKKELDNLISGTKEFDGSINKISKALYWERAKILKGKINTARSGLLNIVKGETTSLLPETASAATTLYIILKGYNIMPRLKYNDIIKKLNSLIQECKREENKTLIETLKLTSRLDGLQTLYNEALKLEEQLYDDEGLNKRKRKAVNTRMELYVFYERLVARLNALALIEGDKEYIELFSWWNALIDGYRRTVNARLGAGKAGSSDDGESSKHDPESGGETGGGGDDDRPVIE